MLTKDLIVDLANAIMTGETSHEKVLNDLKEILEEKSQHLKRIGVLLSSSYGGFGVSPVFRKYIAELSPKKKDCASDKIYSERVLYANNMYDFGKQMESKYPQISMMLKLCNNYKIEKAFEHLLDIEILDNNLQKVRCNYFKIQECDSKEMFADTLIESRKNPFVSCAYYAHEQSLHAWFKDFPKNFLLCACEKEITELEQEIEAIVILLQEKFSEKNIEDMKTILNKEFGYNSEFMAKHFSAIISTYGAQAPEIWQMQEEYDTKAMIYVSKYIHYFENQNDITLYKFEPLPLLSLEELCHISIKEQAYVNSFGNIKDSVCDEYNLSFYVRLGLLFANTNRCRLSIVFVNPKLSWTISNDDGFENVYN